MEKTLEIKRKAQRFVQNGDLDRAVEEYQKLLAADDSDPYTHVTLGDLYFKKGVTDEAGRRYLEAAEAYRKAGLVKNAIAVCKKMLRLNLRPGDTLRSLAELHAIDGLSLDAALYWSQFADLELAHDRRSEAAEALEKASKLLPDEPKYPERLGELWNLEGEKLKASRALIRAARAHEKCGADGPGRELPRPCRGPLSRRPRTARGVAARRREREAAPESGARQQRRSGRGGPSAAPNGTLTGSARRGQPRSLHAAGRRERPRASRARASPPRRTATGWSPPRRRSPSSPRSGGARARSGGARAGRGRGASRLRARCCSARDEREQAAEALLRAAQAWESVGGLDQAASIYNELSRSPQATERLYRLWLANCERRQQWVEAAAVCCELGDFALAAQEPASAHEWFVQARAYDPNNEQAARRLERLSDWGKRKIEPQETDGRPGDRVAAHARGPRRRPLRAAVGVPGRRARTGAGGRRRQPL